MSIPSGYKIPGIFLDIIFGAGPASAGDAPRLVCVVGHLLGGSGTVDTPVLVPSDADAITIFGQGSEGHLMCRAALTADPACNLYGVPLTPPSGGTQAGSNLVFSGTASADGTVTLEIAGTTFSVTIPNGTLAAAAAQLVIDAILDLPDLPVTATLSTATVQIKHKSKGTRGNQITANSSGSVTGLTITHVSGRLTSGAGADTLTTAQANMAPRRFHLIAVPHDTSTLIQSWRDHVNAQAAPLEGRRQQVVAATVDTLANAITLATAINAPRVQVVWHYNGYDTTGQIAACVAARRAYLEGSDPAAPMSAQHGTTLPGLRPQPVLADQPLNSEIATALSNGLSPVVPLSDGTCSLARSITSRSQDTTTAPNYAVLDTSKVTVPDFFADTLQANWSGFVLRNPKLAPDPVDGEDPIPGVATPSSIRTWIYELEKQVENELLVNVDALLPNLSVTLASSPAGRAVAKIPLDVIEGNYQLDTTVQQVG